MNRCIVCRRKIKSGWKYCWQHRNTKPDSYGLPSKRTRRNAHIESSNYTIFFGICVIIPSLLAIFLSGDWGIKFIGFVFLLLGVWVFYSGIGHRKDIKKIIIKDKIRAKMDIIIKKIILLLSSLISLSLFCFILLPHNYIHTQDALLYNCLHY